MDRMVYINKNDEERVTEYEGFSTIKNNFKEIFDGIINVEKNNTNNENANMSSDTPAGQMMKFASETSKDYALKYLVTPKYADAHKEGYIHIHDLDYYPTKTTTCVQYDLEDLFENGFKSKHGFIRQPKSISTYATLATIIFQTNQNEQHGGQSIPAFDFFMAKGVLKSFRRHLKYRVLAYLESDYVEEANQELKDLLVELIDSIVVTDEKKLILSSKLNLTMNEVEKAIHVAYYDTKYETYQAMEGFIHNLNTMHSRGGNQVVFSSINYGTDTSPEGRMLINELLNATIAGLGDGETPIFPIQIFKVKEGLNYSEEDYELALKNWDKAIKGELKYKTPNFDLLIKTTLTTAKRLFPNFVFLDATYNKHELWKMDDPNRYKHEVATMGCRTRVFENVVGEKTSIGRGNLSFTTINFPRLAVEAKNEILAENSGIDAQSLEDKAIERFLVKLQEYTEFVAEQLKERYLFQRTALAKQFPFMMRNNIWKGGNTLMGNDEVGTVLDSGTLGIGFIGGHNAMVALTGKGHGDSKKSYDTLIKALEIMNETVDKYKEKYKLNYSVLATPAESLSGRFTTIDKKRFGEIKDVNDREYYVNSFHIDVKSEISALEKIEKEGKFHELTKGGHITYVELDGEAKKNPVVILQIIKAMKDNNIGYGSINHPIDRCKSCGFESLIEIECPICGSEEISRTRRITGYLTGDLDSWNSFKKAEEKDRIKHGVSK
ncbi:anaerobic ribonucleoside triphosphate reductase [Sebaldella sp. S0638]|uniref:anaerobic ribonucleoside triphosphate reductase n=1 Tax=Sebaldella sp. S0638 TaxID=2957809 RepID=UPI0020A0D959|nr:anaerobic ribonucleoside triphosphate reductase [Sebaldella sp. S0638]MCP1224311.1 anaerobic ribonucleoside triphosphate reductase [Sebaldella sp. S0638]